MQNVKDLIKAVTATEDAFVDELVQERDSWITARSGWEDEINEIREFVYATDTSTTSNSTLPFHNTTTVPKLAQIKMNLTTQYLNHLFPNQQWAQWEGLNDASLVAEVRSTIQSYVRSKLEHSNFEDVAETLLDDWIETGMCAVRTRYVRRMSQLSDTETQTLYSGAVAQRLNPLNVAYDITASDLKSARKVVREIYSIGELKKMVDEDANSFLTPEQFQKLRQIRTEVRNAAANINRQDSIVSRQQVDDGFGELLNYYQGTTVEVLQFYGDYYDMEKDELMSNHRITIVDRRELVEKKPLENVDGGDNVHISTWESRSNSLAPMSPLARIVGMQFKLDKLENLRADVFDRIANPPTVEIGDVQRQGQPGAPGTRYVVEEGGDVRELRHDATVLNADLQQNQTMALMEEMAGSPRESSGFRTPGEKTKFEVQLLDQGGNKTFQRKAKRFENQVLVPVLRDFLELGRRYIDTGDLIKITDEQTDVATFLNITKDALTGQGKIVPKGASIIAAKANALQTINTLLASPISGILMPHTSRMKLLKAVEDLGGLEQFGLFFPHIGLQEDAQSQRFMASLQQGVQEASLTQANVTDEEGLEEGDTGEVS